jgi:hypothetical protein
MIGRALVGGVVAAIAMFILGFIFYATPLYKLGSASLDNAKAAAVQQSLAQNIAKTGTYFVPSGDTPEQTVMYGQGPVATIHYNSGGFSIADPGVMIGGFLHMLVVSLLMAVGLYTLSLHVPGFGERVRLLVLGTIGAAVFMRLGEPLWFHQDWSNAVYLFVADSISLIVAGLVILKLLPKHGLATEAAASGETRAG